MESHSDAELISKTLQVEHKLFYFDLKENPRGRFLKISEKTSATRSTIILPSSGISWFLNLFNYYLTSDDQDLFSKELQLDSKVFYFDVGENQRGGFLKVSESSMSRNRSTIIIPAGITGDEGWAAFRNILAEINEALGLFSMSNQVAGPDRSSIILPLSGLKQFYEILLRSVKIEDEVASGGPNRGSGWRECGMTVVAGAGGGLDGYADDEGVLIVVVAVLVLAGDEVDPVADTAWVGGHGGGDFAVVVVNSDGKCAPICSWWKGWRCFCYVDHHCGFLRFFIIIG